MGVIGPHTGLMTKQAAAKTTAANVRKLPSASEDAQAEAREQADAYDSLFGATPLELDDGSVVMIPPHPDYAMLDDDRMEEWDELLFAVDNIYLREPDVYVPEQRLKDDKGNETGIVMPAETHRGALRQPFQKLDDKGKPELVKPPHSIKVVQIALGLDEYNRLKAGGKNASDVWKIWGEQSLRIRERQQRDSKSAGSPVDLAAVPETDS